MEGFFTSLVESTGSAGSGDDFAGLEFLGSGFGFWDFSWWVWMSCHSIVLLVHFRDLPWPTRLSYDCGFLEWGCWYYTLDSENNFYLVHRAERNVVRFSYT